MTGGAGGLVSPTPRVEAPFPPPVPSSPGLWESMHQVGAVGWSPDMPEQYHGLHPEDRRAGGERIDWIAVPQPVSAARVLSHTCECLPALYELCGLGGAYFIRRTTRAPSGRHVRESGHVPAARAGDLWSRLLGGSAR